MFINKFLLLLPGPDSEKPKSNESFSVMTATSIRLLLANSFMGPVLYLVVNPNNHKHLSTIKQLPSSEYLSTQMHDAHLTDCCVKYYVKSPQSLTLF